MVIFNSYVKLPEGTSKRPNLPLPEPERPPQGFRPPRLRRSPPLLRRPAIAQTAPSDGEGRWADHLKKWHFKVSEKGKETSNCQLLLIKMMINYWIWRFLRQSHQWKLGDHHSWTEEPFFRGSERFTNWECMLRLLVGPASPTRFLQAAGPRLKSTNETRPRSSWEQLVTEGHSLSDFFQYFSIWYPVIQFLTMTESLA